MAKQAPLDRIEIGRAFYEAHLPPIMQRIIKRMEDLEYIHYEKRTTEKWFQIIHEFTNNGYKIEITMSNPAGYVIDVVIDSQDSRYLIKWKVDSTEQKEMEEDIRNYLTLVINGRPRPRDTKGPYSFIFWN